MTKLGWVESFVLVAFWAAALAAFLIGGLPMAGRVLQVFLGVVFCWVSRQLYREYVETVRCEYSRNQAFAEWGKRQQHWKGMDS